MITPDARWTGRTMMETSYVGALLRGARLDGIGPAHFFDPDLRRIVLEIRGLQERGRPVDVALLLDSLRQSGGDADGKEWGAIISRVIDAPAVAENAPEYVRAIAAYSAVDSLASSLRETLQEI